MKLGVNIDHVATLREARLGTVPDPVEVALLAERAGADGIVIHLREDRRHIQDSDAQLLRKKIKTKLNLEMACTPFMVSFACKLKPDDICLVPEKRAELTTEGGLDVLSQKRKISSAVARLKRAGICVSIFIDPHPLQLRAAQTVGADCVELHTGSYAVAKARLQQKSAPFLKKNSLEGGRFPIKKWKRHSLAESLVAVPSKKFLTEGTEFRKLVAAGQMARKLGLVLNAGHGLDYENVAPVAKIEGMNELNIGFSIVARALFVGFENAVREMKSLITE